MFLPAGPLLTGKFMENHKCAGNRHRCSPNYIRYDERSIIFKYPTMTYTRVHSRRTLSNSDYGLNRVAASSEDSS